MVTVGEGDRDAINKESTTLLEEYSKTAFVNGMPVIMTIKNIFTRDLPKSSTQLQETTEMMALKDIYSYISYVSEFDSTYLII